MKAELHISPYEGESRSWDGVQGSKGERTIEEPLTWGQGPRVFDAFLEPTCPFRHAQDPAARAANGPVDGGRDSEPVAVPHSPRRRRHSSGGSPTHFLKARLNAASDSKPTAAATETTFVPSCRSNRLASCMRSCLRYCMGG